MTKAREAGLPGFIRAKGPGQWELLVWAQPGAKKSEPAGIYQDRLKIRLAAPAVDNKANTVLVAYVAKKLGLRKSQVRLEAGHASRRKTLAIQADAGPRWDALAG